MRMLLERVRQITRVEASVIVVAVTVAIAAHRQRCSFLLLLLLAPLLPKLLELYENALLIN